VDSLGSISVRFAAVLIIYQTFVVRTPRYTILVDLHGRLTVTLTPTAPPRGSG
jgi:hypothetical protein